MAHIKQEDEPFTDMQWAQFIENLENVPDIFFGDSGPISFDQQESTLGNIHQGFDPASAEVADNVKREPAEPGMEWALMNQADPTIETPANDLPASPLNWDQVLSRLDNIGRLLEQNARHEEENARQMDRLNAHLAALRPYFQGMRETLKVLTQHVNPQWEVRTPTTPVNMQHGRNPSQRTVATRPDV